MTRGARQRRANQREQGAWNQLVQFHTQVSAMVDRALDDRFGLSMTEYSALSALAKAPGTGGLRMQALAEAVGLNQSSVSRLVARLERQDLVRRSLNERDRRGVFTCITEAGREAEKEAATVYLQTLAAAFDRATTDPDLTDVTKLLGH